MKALILFSFFTLTASAQKISWINTIDGSHFSIRKIIKDSADNLYIIGKIKGKPDFRSFAVTAQIEGNGGDDIFIQKRSSLYDIEWTKIIGGPYDEEGIDIQMTPDGNIVALCNFKDDLELATDEGSKKISSNGEEDILFLKLDESGRIIWARNFGAKYSDLGEHLIVSQNGDILIAGQARGTIDFDPSNSSLFVSIGEYFIAQYDTNGNLIRAFDYPLLTYGLVTDVLTDNEKNIFITGKGSLGFDWPYPDACFVDKLDKFGKSKWFKYYDQNDNYNIGYSLIFDKDSNLVVAGTFEKTLFNIENNNSYISKGLSDIFLATYERQGGNLLTFKTIGDTLQEESSILIHDERDGYLMIVNNNIGPNNNQFGLKWYYGSYYIYNYSMIKLNKNWDITNQLLLSNLNTVVANNIIVYQGDSYLVNGTFDGRVNFDPKNSFSKTSSESNEDVFIQQWDTSFKSKYTLDLGGTSLSDGVDMVINDDGSIYHIGNHIGEIETNLGNFGARLSTKNHVCLFIQKLDAQGKREWIKNIYGTYDIKALKIHKDLQGDLIITGSFSGEIPFDPNPNKPLYKSIGDQDYFIMKLDPNGDFKWVKTFGSKKREDIIDSNIDYLGNIYITGLYSDSIDFDPSFQNYLKVPIGNYPNAFVQKININGGLDWVHSYDPNIIIDKLELSEPEDLILMGRYYQTSDLDPGPAEKLFTSKGSDDLFVTKMNTNGDVQWINSYGGVGIEAGMGLKVSKTGEIYITGYFTDNMMINSKQLVNKGNDDIFILRLDKDGQHQWSSNIGSGTLDQSRDLYLDDNGNYYINGLTYASIDLDQGPAQSNYSFPGANSEFLVKYDQNNKLVWVYSPDADLFRINTIKFNKNENFLITGSYKNVINCNFDSKTIIPIYNSSLYNGFLMNVKEDILISTKETNEINLFEIFPTPVVDQLNIKFPTNLKVHGIEIYNLNGIRIVFNNSRIEKEFSIDVSLIPEGIYFLKIISDSGENIKKFIKL